MARNTVVVSVLANTKGLQKGLGQSQGLLSRVASGARTLTKVAAGTAVAVGAVGLALGWKRLQSLDSARTKMTALGLAGNEIDAAMQATLNSVRGTAFGLGDMADVATLALGAGIRDSDRLNNSLKAVSNAAAVGRTSVGEMGNIFNKVWARGRVTMQEINQLNTRGIAIQGTLAEYLGVTTEELERMISAGLVSAEDLEGAFLSMGDAARIMGDDIAGRASNILAAWGRLGAGIMLPFFNHVKTTMGETLIFLWGVEDRLAPIFEAWNDRMSNAFNFEGAGERALAFIDSLTGMFDGGGFSFEGLIAAVQNGITTAAGWLAGGGMAMLANAFVTGREALLNAALQVFPVLVDAIITIIPAVVAGIATMATGIVSLIASSAPAILDAGMTMLLGLIDAVVTVVPLVVTSIVGLVPQLVASLVSMLPVLLAGAVQLFTAIVQAIPLVLPPLLQGIVTLLPVIIGAILEMVPVILDAAVQLFTALVQAIPVILPMLLTAIIDLLPLIIESILSLIPAVLDAAVDLFIALVDAIPVILPMLINAIITLLPRIITTVIGMLPRLLEAAVRLFTGIVTAVPRIIPQLIPTLLGLLPSMLGALLGMIPALVQAGIDLIGGLIRGIGQMAGAVVSALVNIAKGAIKGFLSFLGIKSPSRVFAGFGRDIVRGLVDGIDKSERLAVKAVDHLGSAVTGAFDAQLTPSELALAVNGSHMASWDAATYNITVQAVAPGPEIGRAIVEAIDSYRSAGGRR